LFDCSFVAGGLPLTVTTLGIDRHFLLEMPELCPNEVTLVYGVCESEVTHCHVHWFAAATDVVTFSFLHGYTEATV
jgi:hypothetical protein